MREITIDSNVFLRFLLRDIEDQFQQSKEVIESIQRGETVGNISILVINELIWILETYYGLKRTIYVPKILKLLLLEHMKVIEIRKEDLKKVLEKFQKQKFDFTDIYLSSMVDPNTVISFDKDFQKIRKF